jgi:Uma2 family endonuclease
MGSIEIIDKPLDRAELSRRYAAMIDDPLYSGITGRLELNGWGQIIMTPPADVWHYCLAARLARRLAGALGGESFQEGAIACEGSGVLIADVVWCSPAFFAAHGRDRVLQRAPEICVEVLSPSNSTREIDEKTRGYLAAGALEVWIVDPEGGTITVHGQDGVKRRSGFGVDLAGLFDA